MSELVRRVAMHPRGLAFLHLGELESVAIALDMHPFAVEEARGLLETPEGRAHLIEEYKRARVELRNAPPAQDEPPAGEPPPPGSPAALIRAAREHEFGASFLVEGYPEVVAVTYQVHPDLVFRARELLARWERVNRANKAD